MRILFIGPLPEPVTGQSLACQVLLDGLKIGNLVDVVDLNKSGFKQGVSSISRILEVALIAWRVWRLRKKARVIYFTVSESFAGNLKDLLIFGVCFAQLSRMVIHLHGGAGMRGIMLGDRLWVRRANEFFLRRIGAIVVLGARLVDIYAGAVGRSKIHIVPNFAQDEFFTSAEQIADKFLRVDPLRILFLSNLLPGKGHTELLDAFAQMDPSNRRRLRIDFAGGFESKEQERAFRKKIADDPQISYHGTVRGNEKKQLLLNAHVFCLPTYYPYEGQPISMLEAYASGCAVIATDHSGIFDVFADGINGYRVEKRSPSSIRNALERALAEPRNLEAIAQTNLLTAQRLYRVEHFNSALVKLITEVAASQRC
jgi:glycosyltransferase involved in cell wall biosynthesis